MPPGTAWHPPDISIHAPREGSDLGRLKHLDVIQVISIHAPREGSDTPWIALWVSQQQISIHAPREGSDNKAMEPFRPLPISIHAPREGSDSDCLLSRHFSTPFLSTLPARGATHLAGVLPPHLLHISIHAPREGSDSIDSDALTNSSHFYPRSPRGERRCGITGRTSWVNFYPRSPRGERPPCPARSAQSWGISIHAPREGSDSLHSSSDRCFAIFLSTLPARGATRVA